MVAVRALISTLNSLTQSGLHASGLLRPDQDLVDGGVAAGPAPATGSSSEPWGEGEYAEGGVEPLLEELLHDPMVHLLMRADRLEPEQVRALLTSRQWRAEP